jgi:hypothetical protein
LEEKRETNEILLRGTGVKDKQIKANVQLAKMASKDNLAALLPKLKTN